MIDSREDQIQKIKKNRLKFSKKIVLVYSRKNRDN